MPSTLSHRKTEGDPRSRARYTSGDITWPVYHDGHGKTNISVLSPPHSTWLSQGSTSGTVIEQLGTAGEVPVAGAYDGDGMADLGECRPNGAKGAEWLIPRSSGGTFSTQFGASTDKTVPGDYTDNGKFDIAVWRPSTGEWFVLRNEDSSYYSFPFGIACFRARDTHESSSVQAIAAEVTAVGRAGQKDLRPNRNNRS